jgi:hypothetical protein
MYVGSSKEMEKMEPSICLRCCVDAFAMMLIEMLKIFAMSLPPSLLMLVKRLPTPTDYPPLC